MKIAFLTPYIPYPPDTGGKIRSFHLLKQMALRHEVDLFSVYYSGHTPDITAIKPLCADIHLYELSKPVSFRYNVRRVLSGMPLTVEHFITPRSVHLVQQYLQSHHYDVIFVDEIVMVPYAFQLAVPRILSLQKIDYRHYWETAQARPWGLKKLRDSLESFKLWRFQRRALNDSYIECIVCSIEDKHAIQQSNPRIQTTVVPNGVDCAQFSNCVESNIATTAQEPTLMYVGTMNYYPNIDAILHFWQEIYPRIRAQIPSVRLLIVGHQPPPEITQLQNLPKVVVTGSVPDVRPFLAQSTAMIVPLRLGGGTRLKILEALMSGVPVISSSIGAQGLDLINGQDILVADDPEDFAAKTVQLLNDPGLHRALVTRGRQAAQRYDWSVLLQRMMDDWPSLLSITSSIKNFS